MVISKRDDTDYRYMVYTGKLRVTADNMWLVVAEQFAMTDFFSQFGALVTIKRDDEQALSLYFNDDDGNSTIIDMSHDTMAKLVSGEIVEVHVW